MDGLFEIAFALLIFGACVETVLYFFGTSILGRAAFLPYGEARVVDLGPAAQEVLSGRRAVALANEGRPREPSDYRSPPKAPTPVPQSVLGTLSFAPKMDGESHISYADHERDELVVRLPFRFFGTRTYGLVRIRLAFDGHRVSVKGAFLPVPGLTYLLALALLTMAAMVAGKVDLLIFPAVMGAALLINGLISWFRLRGPVEGVRMQIESGLYSLR
jgi:hypothetical protein